MSRLKHAVANEGSPNQRAAATAATVGDPTVSLSVSLNETPSPLIVTLLAPSVAEVELWSASLAEGFFLLDFDLLLPEELSALPVSELAAVSDLLFLDFVLEDFVLDDFVSLAAAA